MFISNANYFPSNSYRPQICHCIFSWQSRFDRIFLFCWQNPENWNSVNKQITEQFWRKNHATFLAEQFSAEVTQPDFVLIGPLKSSRPISDRYFSLKKNSKVSSRWKRGWIEIEYFIFQIPAMNWSFLRQNVVSSETWWHEAGFADRRSGQRRCPHVNLHCGTTFASKFKTFQRRKVLWNKNHLFNVRILEFFPNFICDFSPNFI